MSSEVRIVLEGAVLLVETDAEGNVISEVEVDPDVVLDLVYQAIQKGRDFEKLMKAPGFDANGSPVED